ncbi:hypothetical protein SteCoe_8472 [Stentor coeruleus]|uniref:Cation efflux protein cytoplasmic domain-containing protein n=1 Tax=Stentor coeruleus TaxID=5963 RepID=A0A1R2CK12_9CILI|nr:hypothetical protein SteCoe_8472 [Stentor coeruleus]
MNSKSHDKVDQVENVQTGISKKFTLHQKSTKKYLRRLYFNLVICTCFMTGEIVGGIVSGSIAILTDAFHIFTDILGFLISIASLHITRKPATFKLTFGFYRAEVLGAVLSIALIWGLTAWLVSEAIIRMISPATVDGLIMLVTACGGLAGNIIMGIVLINADPEQVDTEEEEDEKNEGSTGKGENAENVENAENSEKLNEGKNTKKKSKSLNMRASIIHVIGDSIQSIGVIIAGGIIYSNPDYKRADPVCTLLFCIVVLGTTVPILKDCIKILMETTPSDVDISEISKSIKEIDEVIDVHDIHVWSLSSGKVSFSCHIVSNNPNYVLENATKLLKEKFHIGHLTIQIEAGDSSIEFTCENDLH